MTTQTLGILTLGVCLILFLFAFRLFRHNRIGLSLALIILAGLLLRIQAGTDMFLHNWDERYHALVAKNLIKHPLVPTLYDDPALPYDYRRWDAGHVWLHKQPAPLWAMALSMRTFGVNEIALRLPSILLSTLAIGLTYSIGSLLFTAPVGLTAAALHAINGLIIQTTAGRVASDHIDLFHLFFVELAIFLAVLHSQTGKRRIIPLIGLAVGVAILCKWLTALIVFPLWFIMVRAKDKPMTIAVNAVIIAAVCSATFLPWQVYIHATFPLEARWESAFNLRHITEPLEGHGGSWLFHFRGLAHYGEFIALPIIWFLLRTARNWRESRYLMPTVWLVVPFAFFTMVKTKMDTYTLFVAPSIFIMSAAFIHAVYTNRTRPGYRLLRSMMLVLLIGGPVFHLAQTIEPFRPANRSDKHDKRWADILRTLGRQVPDSQAIYFSTRPIETMFYTAGIGYPGLPTGDQIADLKKRGYSVNIIDTGKIPAEIRGDSRVTIITPSDP